MLVFKIKRCQQKQQTIKSSKNHQLGGLVTLSRLEISVYVDVRIKTVLLSHTLCAFKCFFLDYFPCFFFIF